MAGRAPCARSRGWATRSTRPEYGLADYLRDRGAFLAAYALGASAVGAVAFLGRGAEPVAADVAYAAVVGLAVLAAWAALDYGRVSRFPSAALRQARLESGPGYAASLPEPASREQALWKESAALQEKALLARVSAAESRGRSFADYLVLWAHEVKTPVAAARVELEACRMPAPARDSVLEELESIEEGVERVLYSARADTFARDYLIRPTDALAIVRQAVSAMAPAFVRAGLSFSAEGPAALVPTDPKWLAFAVRQVLSNSLKYTPRGGRVTATLGREGAAWVLRLRDSGRGVPPEDLPRVFERGFTGGNGRDHPGATGMGLYIVARLCEEMGHAVSASSEPGRFTEIAIAFRDDSGYLAPAGRVTKA